MDTSYTLSSFKTEKEYYSILEDKIVSKVDWEEKDIEEKEYCYIDFGVWTLFFKDNWLVSLVDQRIVEEVAAPPFNIIYMVKTRDEGLMSFYNYGEAFTCAAVEEYYSMTSPIYTAKEYMKKVEEIKTDTSTRSLGGYTLEDMLAEIWERLEKLTQRAKARAKKAMTQTIITFEDFAFDDKQEFKLVLKLLKHYWVERNNLSFGFNYIYISYS